MSAISTAKTEGEAAVELLLMGERCPRNERDLGKQMSDALSTHTALS